MSEFGGAGSGLGLTFTAEPYKAANGTYYPNYSYGYGVRWVSSWTFKPDPPAKAAPLSKGSITSAPEQTAAVPTKKPKPVLGSTQTKANAGDTVPIVFAFRINGIGGTWVQPSLVKTAYALFEPLNLFAVSQGEIAGMYDLTRMWCGNRNLTYGFNFTFSVTQDYVTAVDGEASPNVCPLYYSKAPSIGRIFCDYDAYSFVGNTLTASGGTVRRPDIVNNYYYYGEITKGTGDTDNSVIRYNNTVIEVFDSATGNDVTAAYWAYLGINPVGTYSYANAKYSGGTIIGGWGVGYYRDVVGSSSSLVSPTGAVPYSTGPVVFNYGSGTVINQINPALPADSGTLWGVSQTWKISPYVNPASPPVTEDFTNYSDVTWLTVYGYLWDPNVDNYYDPAAPVDIPTEFKQLSVWYNFGVKVDLYSAGLIGGVYLNSSSRYFVDLAMYLFTLMKRANGILTDSLAAPIDVLTLPYFASFHYSEQLFFNGIVDQSINVIEYISQIAPFFFLSFISSGGQYAFRAAVPLGLVGGFPVIDVTPQDTTYMITFTEDIILPGSFQKKYFSSEDRRSISVSVLWRDADPATVSKQQTTVIRYPETASDAPTVQFDMTDFCCTQAHAVKYAKYELARRRYSTHSISFATQLGNLTGYDVTDIIKVERQRINSRGDNRTEIEYYQITKLSHTGEGATLVEAAQFPLNASDIYTINNEIVNGTFTIT